MVYKGFTWNCGYGRAAQLARLLETYILVDAQFYYESDRRLAQAILAELLTFMEVSPDGCSPTHGTADA